MRCQISQLEQMDNRRSDDIPAIPRDWDRMNSLMDHIEYDPVGYFAVHSMEQFNTFKAKKEV